VKQPSQLLQQQGTVKGTEVSGEGMDNAHISPLKVLHLKKIWKKIYG